MSKLILNHRVFEYKRLNGEQTELTCECIQCKKPQTFIVPSLGLFHYQRGGLIQDCFPNVEPAIRELMVSGMCGECWKKIFSENPDE